MYWKGGEECVGGEGEEWCEMVGLETEVFTERWGVWER